MSRRAKLDDLRAGAPLVLPSLLLCDFGHLADEVQRLAAAGVRGVHLDVMDGHFVPNLSYGLPVVEAVRRACDLVVDVHLMISDPHRYVRQFYDAGADVITFHAEATDHRRELVAEIHELGAAAGVAINPGTPIDVLADCLDACDVVLVMSVEAGFGGQAFNPLALEKLATLRKTVAPTVLLEVDGGVNGQTIRNCTASGADLLVVGSAIFKSDDYARSVRELVRAAVSQ
jgi:ribulose-phosphate 3-epimerase